MSVFGFARRFLSLPAFAIAGLLVLFDYVAHQSAIPFAVVEEPFPYYALKFLAFYLAAMLAFWTNIAKRPSDGPPFIGVLGAIFVGIAYFFVTFVPLGQRTIGGQVLWGLLHFAMGYLAASMVLKRPRGILFAAIILMVVIGLGFVFESFLAATPPGPPNY